jgi:hypothetical protein
MDIDDIINVVIIRFSVRHRRLFIFKNEESRDNWFIFRSKLFNSYLRKCLHHQTKKPNKVYVLVDKGDRNLVEKYLNIDNINVIYCNIDMRYYGNQILGDLCKNKLVKNLVVSRIDSDDLINKDFFYNINQQLLLHPAPRLVACKGYRSDLTNIQSLFFTNSPFISKCTNFGNFSVKDLCSFSPHDINHDLIDSVEHTQNHNAEWIQLIHHTNICNQLLNNNIDDKLIVTPLVPIDPIWFANWAGFQFTKVTESNYS